MNRAASLVILLLAIAACGGDDEETVPTEILPASNYQGRCEKPRTGKDANGRAFLDRDGSLLQELLWLRSWTDDTYLWYKEVPVTNPKMFTKALDYFNILKSNVVTSTGKQKDHFHFTYTTADWLALSQSGVEASYGLQWVLLAGMPPREIVVAYVQQGSPADLAGIKRGARAVTVDGAAVKDSADVDTLNKGLFPDQPDQTHTLVLQDLGAPAQRTVTLKSASLSSTPVRRIALAAPDDKIGYLQFNDHIATAEKALIDEITKLQADKVTDLVLDIRYNGGGYLSIAAELAYMIAGPAVSANKTFDKIQFNDKHPTTDPVTGETIKPEGFPAQSPGFFSVPLGTPLPHLDLKQVYVLTGPGTCSASEAVMNGLAGVDVKVIQIGTTTCGKPYGFYATDNCGTTYFSIQFQGVNDKGFGDYSDGFIPGGKNPGCVVADDFSHELGDPAEARLAAALAYIKNPVCPPALRSSHVAAFDGEVPKPLWRQNAILTR